VSKSDRQTEGQLSERPLAELIREVIDADLSGAIRLSHGPAKVVVYFEKGQVHFATSNVRAHRLRRVLKRTTTVALDSFPSLMSDEEFVALVRGELRAEPPTLVRIHSQCLTGDVFGSVKCDCGPQLQAAMRLIADEGCGVIVYQQQEGRGIGS